LTLRIRRDPKTPLDPISRSLSCQQVRVDDCGVGLRPVSEETDRGPVPRSFRWLPSSRPKPRRKRCHRERRAAGCCTQGHDNRRFRLERWTFARNLEGATPKGIAPDDHPDAGVPVVRDHESDKTSLHVDRKLSPEMPAATNPTAVRPKAKLNPPLLFPDHAPEGLWSLVANATPNRIPPGWRPVTDRNLPPTGRAGGAGASIRGSSTQQVVVVRPGELST
jgi:hypothetical protein